MSFELSIGKPGTLNIIYMGTINREQISSVRENAIAMINANGLNNILCDIRDATLNLEYADLLNFDASSRSVNPEIKKQPLYMTLKIPMMKI